MCFLQSWRLESSRSTFSVWWGPASWFTDGHIFTIVSPGKRGKGAFSGLFVRSLIPLWRLCPHDLIASQRTHLLIPSCWGLDFNIWLLRGHKHSAYSSVWHIFSHFRWQSFQSSELRSLIIIELNFLCKWRMTQTPHGHPWHQTTKGASAGVTHTRRLHEPSIGVHASSPGDTASSLGWTQICSSSFSFSDYHSCLYCYIKHICFKNIYHAPANSFLL